MFSCEIQQLKQNFSIMICWSYSLSTLVIILNFFHKCDSQSKVHAPRKLNIATLNQKAVGVMLKASGKRYYVSAELCPGGVFLTRPVNENCLCYNGIFQIVRDCCNTRNTRIFSDNLEWRMDFKCGTSPELGNSTVKNRPIRAILPLSKPRNRFGSMIITRSLAGNSSAKWRKFDTDDIIIGNNAEVNMNGKSQFEIVNIRPLGREIKIVFGKSSNMAVCYNGWLTEEGHQNLRVRVSKHGEAVDCCFNITQSNSPGEIKTNCSTGSIITEIVDVQSADVDIGQCDQDIPEEAPHVINKRNPFEYQKAYTKGLSVITQRLSPNEMASNDARDILGDRGPILFKRAAVKGSDTQTPLNASGTQIPLNASGTQTVDDVILPRRKGISSASIDDQARTINEFIAILRNDLNVEIREPKTPRFQMLKKSFDIFLNVVPTDVVPNMLIKTAFDVFYFLYEELEPIIHTPPEIFTETMKFLDKCLNREPMLNFSTTGCPKQIDELNVDAHIKDKMESYHKDKPEELERILKALKRVNIRKDKRFVLELHDIYVEINWKVADFVHSLCFDYFEKDFTAHTYYESELESLFLFDVVQKRWFFSRTDLRYVRGIFPVSDLKLSMKQLDTVIGHAHQLSRYNGSYWLERPRSSKGPENRPLLRSKSYSPNPEARLIFVKNLLEDARVEASNERNVMALQGRAGKAVSSAERTLTYPFELPDKLTSGEVIWDGLAICLHASYSNSRRYFVDSDLWGVTPSLLELGQLYP